MTSEDAVAICRRLDDLLTAMDVLDGHVIRAFEELARIAEADERLVRESRERAGREAAESEVLGGS